MISVTIFIEAFMRIEWFTDFKIQIFYRLPLTMNYSRKINFYSKENIFLMDIGHVSYKLKFSV